MSTQPIDYDALAKKFGAIDSQPDYDALAKQFGAIESGQQDLASVLARNKENVAAQAPAVEREVAAGGGRSVPRGFGLGVLSRVAPLTQNPLPDLVTSLPSAFNPLPANEEELRLGGAIPGVAPMVRMGRGVGGAVVDSAKDIYQGAGSPKVSVRPGGFSASVGEVDPERIAEGATGLVTDVGMLALGARAPKVKLPSALPTAREVAAGLRSKGPRPATPGLPIEAAKLPIAAVDGAEKVFRAAAPTGSNPGFRGNVYAAVGDLAEIGRKLDLAESRGGVIRPDMRVRSTVEAINSHLDEMYQQERAPQIARHADTPVEMAAGADAERGLQFLKRSAGTVADQGIAAKALETGKLTLAEADQLAKTANQYLKNFESMTKAEKLEVLSKTPKVAGLKALDVALGKKLNGTLADLGEPGLRAYERRFAALSEVRDQLQARMNAVELDVSRARVARPLLSLLRGKAGIASASQAAVADVNIGRTLQKGLKKLAESGIKPERGKPQRRP